MAKICRILKKDEVDGGPLTGSTGATLGVRVPTDIVADASNRVHPNTGGMSVSPSFISLIRRLPVRFRTIVPGAVGRDTTFVWTMGEGSFVASTVSVNLQLTIDPHDAEHGYVEPDAVMDLKQYVDALHATKGQWVIDEPELV